MQLQGLKPNGPQGQTAGLKPGPPKPTPKTIPVRSAAKPPAACSAGALRALWTILEAFQIGVVSQFRIGVGFRRAGLQGLCENLFLLPQIETGVLLYTIYCSRNLKKVSSHPHSSARPFRAGIHLASAPEATERRMAATHLLKRFQIEEESFACCYQKFAVEDGSCGSCRRYSDCGELPARVSRRESGLGPGGPAFRCLPPFSRATATARPFPASCPIRPSGP